MKKPFLKLIFFSVFAGLLAVIIRGYHFGVEDQVDQIILIKKLLDPTFLSHDYIFSIDSSNFTPRFFFVHLIVFINQFISLEWSYFLLTLISSILVGLLTGLMSYFLIGRSLISAMLAVVLVLSINSIQIGGSSEITSGILIPQILAIPLAFLAFILLIKNRPIFSVFVSGISGLFHPLIGLETASLLISTVIIQKIIHLKYPRFPLQKISLKSLIFSIVILGFFSGIWFLNQSDFNQVDSATFIQEYALFRAPHHYIPSSWPKMQFFELGSFLIAVILGWNLWRKKTQTESYNVLFLPILFSQILILLGFAYIFVEIIPTRFWVVVQPFRLIFIIKWLGLIYIAYFIIAMRPYLKRGISSFINQILLIISLFVPVIMGPVFLLSYLKIFNLWFQLLFFGLIFYLESHFFIPEYRNFLIFSGLVSLFFWFLLRINFLIKLKLSLLVLIVTGVYVFYLHPDLISRFKPQISLNELKGDDIDVALAAKKVSDMNDIFLVPPHLSQFRILSDRAEVVDWKSDPYHDFVRSKWRDRLFNVYGFAEPGLFESNYQKITDPKLKELGLKYNSRFAVLFAETSTALPVVYKNTKYKIIKIN